MVRDCRITRESRKKTFGVLHFAHFHVGLELPSSWSLSGGCRFRATWAGVVVSEESRLGDGR